MRVVLAQVPFAEHAGGVTRLLHGLGDGDFFQGQFGDVVHGPQGTRLPLKAADAAHGVDAGAGGVLAAHEGGTCGLAVLAVVMPRELHALGSEFVDVGRFVVFGAEAGHVSVAEVIRENEDDVWRAVCGMQGQGEEEEAEQVLHGPLNDCPGQEIA